MPVPILSDLVIIFGRSLLVLFSCHPLRLPAYGVSVLAIRRGPEMLVNPDGEMRGRPDDLWFVLGAPDQLARVAPLFSNPQRKGNRS